MRRDATPPARPNRPGRNSQRPIPPRKAFPALQHAFCRAGVEMPYLAIKPNIAESPNIVVQIER